MICGAWLTRLHSARRRRPQDQTRGAGGSGAGKGAAVCAGEGGKGSCCCCCCCRRRRHRCRRFGKGKARAAAAPGCSHGSCRRRKGASRAGGERAHCGSGGSIGCCCCCCGKAPPGDRREAGSSRCRRRCHLRLGRCRRRRRCCHRCCRYGYSYCHQHVPDERPRRRISARREFRDARVKTFAHRRKRLNVIVGIRRVRVFQILHCASNVAAQAGDRHASDGAAAEAV